MRGRGMGLRPRRKLLRWCTCDDTVQTLISRRKREREGEKRETRKRTNSFAYPSCFLDFVSPAFHILPREPDSVGCANEDLRVLVPSYRAAASAPVIWRTLKYVDTVAHVHRCALRDTRGWSEETSRRKESERGRERLLLWNEYRRHFSAQRWSIAEIYAEWAYRVYWHFVPSSRNYSIQCILLTPRKMEAEPSPYPIKRAIALWQTSRRLW